MLQGFEAGGHVRGVVTSLALIPAARDAVGPELPIIAAGGFADGRGLAAALALGADAAVFGTRFVASQEAAANEIYRQRIIGAQAEDTVHTELFDMGWPNAAHRVLRTKVVDEWERAGRPESGKRPGEGESIGKLNRAGLEAPMVKYSVMAPTTSFEGDIEELPFYAGMSVGLVREIPARRRNRPTHRQRGARGYRRPFSLDASVTRLRIGSRCLMLMGGDGARNASDTASTKGQIT